MRAPVCRAAEPKDLRQVVNVHLEAFPGFFLTSLGPRFLEVMYRALLTGPGAVFLVAETESGVIEGFAVGMARNVPRDRSLALKGLPSFLLAVIPAVARNPVLVTRRLAAQMFSRNAQPVFPVGAAVLRSIGVRPQMKGGGAAGRLLTAFEAQAHAKGASSVALTTDALHNERAIGFYTKQGYSAWQEFEQHGSRRMLLMTKSLN